ncbi:hypothetical protein FTO74_13850 [Granulicella sp. WH15]|uniref:hypothetical protein n=1 Tax=Granulicella sp. WH15 TaxID=2602070 RepID=UPI001366F711|nr:hypothetical protein [Granulicella sp. WH15]QHN04325.1 hypothetical protein FTO74_13850 [Granulicella sp. WH15]
MELKVAGSGRRPSEWAWATKFYLFLLVFVIPMDWFQPTGLLFREGGAKPAIPLMILGSIVIIGARWRQFIYALPSSSLRVLYVFGGIFVCGTGAFVLNLVFGWSRFGATKDPVTQFVTQAMLFLVTPFIIVAHADLFAGRRWSAFVMNVIPWAALVHLAAAVFQVIGLLQPDRMPLELFRNGTEEFNSRVAGLLSEPSYFGTMAALYGIPLLLAYPTGRKRRYILLAFLLFAMSLYGGGKTVVPVTICGFLGFMWYSRARILTLRNIIVLLVVATISAIVVVQNAALNVQDNLSTAMRFGSTATSLNAAFAGYGILGVGFGQFHFMFLERFMPTFLLFSQEAVDQMSSAAEHRASTFNIFTRYLIETGVCGLLLFFAFLQSQFRMAREDQRSGSLLGILLISVSLGFLLTQEPYCYPPIMLGASLVLGSHNEVRRPALGLMGRK